MVDLDADDDPDTTNSSAADLAVPSGGAVLWAGLYWGARQAAGAKGRAGVGDRKTMQLRVPGADYRTVTSQPRTDASFTMPAARRGRNWPSRSRSRLPICARSKRKASRSMPHAA